MKSWKLCNKQMIFKIEESHKNYVFKEPFLLVWLHFSLHIHQLSIYLIYYFVKWFCAVRLIFYRLALFVATVATDSAVFVARLHVSKKKNCLSYSIFTSSLRSVQDFVWFVASSNRIRRGLFYRITMMFG